MRCVCHGRAAPEGEGAAHLGLVMFLLFFWLFACVARRFGLRLLACPVNAASAAPAYAALLMLRLVRFNSTHFCHNALSNQNDTK